MSRKGNEPDAPSGAEPHDGSPCLACDQSCDQYRARIAEIRAALLDGEDAGEVALAALELAEQLAAELAP